MTRSRRPLVAGNWKMNGVRATLSVATEIAKAYDLALAQKVELAICPPATLLYVLGAALTGTRISTSGQDCHAAESGAFTGDLSAAMLADCGARYCIVGHSERRTLHGETSEMVCDKAVAVQAQLLVPIICVGETLEQRESGKTLAVIRKQLRASVPQTSTEASLVIAYEPVWAIGTGRTPSAGDVGEVHAFMRAELARLIGRQEAAGVRLLYGGSVKPSNAAELMAVADVDGALVGGASLSAPDFLGIAKAFI